MKNIISILLLCMLYRAYGQVSVSGVVKDAETDKFLTGVNVYLPDLEKGMITDQNGKYKIHRVPNGYIKIQFSYVGYKTVLKTVHIENSDVILNVDLEITAIRSEEVIISAGSPSSQHENAIKIETIDIKRPDEISTGSLIKDIALVPGMNVISKGNGVVTPVIRGLSTSNIIVLNNGVRMENFQFSENHPFLIDESVIDRIEIIKGPASLLYGSDAIGGVVSLIPEKPAPADKITGDINTRYYFNNDGIDAGAGIKGTHKNIFWGLRGHMKSFTDYSDGSGTVVPNSRYNTGTLSLFSGFQNESGVFRIYYSYNKMNLGMPIPQAFEEVVSNGRNNNVWYQNLDDHFLVSKNNFFLNHWNIETDISYQQNHRKLNTEPSHEHFTDVDMLLKSVNYKIKSTFNISGNNRIFFGYQGMYQQNSNADAPSRVLPDYSLIDNSLFVLYQSSVSEKINIQTGMRYDFRNYNVPEQEASSHSHEEHTEEGTDEHHMEALSRQYGNISGSAGIVFHITRKLILRSNLASAYRTPHISELTQDGLHGERYESGDRDLKSQRSYEADMGIHFFTENLKCDVAIFYNYVTDYIHLSPSSDTTEDGYPVYYYVQNTSRLYGTESSLEYHALNYLSVRAGYSHVTGIQKDGEYLPFIPQDKLLLSFKVQKDKWKKLSNMFFLVQTVTVLSQNHPSLFETKTTGYNLVNLGGGFSVESEWISPDISVQVTNVFNKTYIDHLSTLKGTGYYNMGRNVIVSLKIPLNIR